MTLAFGKRDEEIYKAVRHLSSDSLRTALGCESFATLQRSAQAEAKSLNAFCLSILRGHIETNGQSAAAWLPRFKTGNPHHLRPDSGNFQRRPLRAAARMVSLVGGVLPCVRRISHRNVLSKRGKRVRPFWRHGYNGSNRVAPRQEGVTTPRSTRCYKYLTQSKVIALQLRDRDRTKLTDEIARLSETLNERIDAAQQDFRLKQTYNSMFGESAFFDDDVFADVLRCRTLIDDIGCTAPPARALLAIAVLRALIPASRLIRRGDLRYKTERELARGRAELRTEIRTALAVIARDIARLSPIDHRPVLLLENAKNLGRIPTLSVDTVITSPPYLNGTNYFRNTKVELWFLRCLKGREDLSRFRFGSMTCGN